MVKIIAEIGSGWCRTDNEEQNFEKALMQIKHAKETGADAVKFQLFTHEELYGFPGDNTYSLPANWLERLAENCHRSNIEFMCSVFSPHGVRLVDPFVSVHKVASSEIVHIELLEEIAKTGKPVIISTAGAREAEIENAVKTIGGPRVTLLECVGQYPAAPMDYQLSVLEHWRETYGVAVGVSDHTKGNSLIREAILSGATVFEKHVDFLSDRSNLKPTPDSAVSIGRIDFALYVAEIRKAASDLPKHRRPGRADDDMLLLHRRRLVATKDIKAGDPFVRNDNYGAYRVKTPDNKGLSALAWYHVDRKGAKRDIKAGETIGPQDV